MRTYELAIVADPRLSDDDFTSLVADTKQLITSRGGEVVREESWGKRKLAYPIRKLNEGRYMFLYLQMEAKRTALFPEVELRLNQNEKVLRYLTVRTDLDLKRAANRAKPGEPVRTFHSEPEGGSAAGPDAKPAAEPAVEPAVGPDAKPAAEPAVESAAGPDAKPAAEPAAGLEAKPAAEPAAGLEAKPAAEPTAPEPEPAADAATEEA